MISPYGKLEVAIAVAMTSNLARVDATATPFTTTPDNLFEQTFRQVGINDAEMPLFKANLAKLLPEIETFISNINNDADQVVKGIAEQVKITLLDATHGSGGTP